MNEKSLKLFISIVSLTFLLVVFWEFFIEGFFDVSIVHDGAESSAEHWEYVATSTVFAAIASIFPLWLLGKQESKMKAAEDKLKLTQFSVDHTANAAFWIEKNGKFVYVNEEACSSLNYTREELLSLTVFDISPDFPRDQWPGHWEELKQRGFSTFETVHGKKDGSTFPVEISANFLDYNGKEYNCAFAQDITGRKIAEEQIRKLSNAVEHSSAQVVITDSKGNIEYVNPQFNQVTGYSDKEVIGENPRILKSGKTPPDVYEDLWQTVSSGHSWKGEFINQKKNGEIYWEGASISPVLDDNGRITHYVAVKEDITARKEMEEELRRLSSTDSLTGLANRSTLNNVLEREWSRSLRAEEPCSIAMLDIDYFKNYNDKYGHQAGDDCLKKVSALFKESVKRPGDIVARYGGEEFCMILPNTGTDDALEIVEGVRKKIEELEIKHEMSDAGDYVTVSIGISTAIPERGSSSEILLGKADKALYKAKNDGRNCVRII